MQHAWSRHILHATGCCRSMLTDDADQVPDCQHLVSQDTVSWCNQPATDCPQIALLIYILMLENKTGIKSFAAKRLKKSRNPAACLFLADAHLPVYTQSSETRLFLKT